MYTRIIEKSIKASLFQGQMIVIYGARQVGKTTLAKKIIEDTGLPFKYFSLDTVRDREDFSIADPEHLKRIFGEAKIVLVDEAQLVSNIGQVLKAYYDKYNEVQIIATGSSSFDLANKFKEPMTGRTHSFLLYPLSVREIAGENIYDFRERQEYCMRYGFYPRIQNKDDNLADAMLAELTEANLYKDIYMIEGIKKPEVLQKLIKVLAINIGHTLTTGGLAKSANTSNKTVERYIDLLEKFFVIKRLNTYSRNLNNELKRAFKIYFMDIGMRNSVIQNHNKMELRNDIGQLFKNFWVIERLKAESYKGNRHNSYFWQTYNDIEVDYIEESNGELKAFECKWSDRPSKGIKIFEAEYKNEGAKSFIVNKDNYLEYL